MRIIANHYKPGEVIKFIREWTEQTQTEFGEEIGLSKMSIQGYELGQRRYYFETLMKIADKYELTVTIEAKKKGSRL